MNAIALGRKRTAASLHHRTFYKRSTKAALKQVTRLSLLTLLLSPTALSAQYIQSWSYSGHTTPSGTIDIANDFVDYGYPGPVTTGIVSPDHTAIANNYADWGVVKSVAAMAAFPTLPSDFNDGSLSGYDQNGYLTFLNEYNALTRYTYAPARVNDFFQADTTGPQDIRARINTKFSRDLTMAYLRDEQLAIDHVRSMFTADERQYGPIAIGSIRIGANFFAEVDGYYTKSQYVQAGTVMQLDDYISFDEYDYPTFNYISRTSEYYFTDLAPHGNPALPFNVIAETDSAFFSKSDEFMTVVDLVAGEDYRTLLSLYCEVTITGIVSYMAGTTATCDAGKSGYWSGISGFTDTNDAPRTDVVLTSASGFDYRYAPAASPALDARLPALPPAVPEPATWVTLIVGFALVGGAARRQRRARFSPA